MSKKSRIHQFVSLYEKFTNASPLGFFDGSPAYSDFDGLTVEEALAELRFILSTVDALRSANALSELPWHVLQNLQNQLQSVHNTFQQLLQARDQNAWQGFAQAVDVMALHVRQYGLPGLALGEAKLERTLADLLAERERLLAARTEVERLSNEVRTLITPAVAGSLSQAFTARRDSLFKGRLVWFFVSLAVGIVAVATTFSVVDKISAAMASSAASGASGATVAWGAAIVRAAVLLPLFAVFGFAFSQYRRERELEEEYAHKAAVATSLPNYGDLAREPAVRDQIVSGATTVIFTSPLGTSRERAADSGAVESATKLLDRKSVV